MLPLQLTPHHPHAAQAFEDEPHIVQTESARSFEPQARPDKGREKRKKSATAGKKANSTLVKLALFALVAGAASTGIYFALRKDQQDDEDIEAALDPSKDSSEAKGSND